MITVTKTWNYTPTLQFRGPGGSSILHCCSTETISSNRFLLSLYECAISSNISSFVNDISQSMTYLKVNPKIQLFTKTYISLCPLHSLKTLSISGVIYETL